MQRQIPFRPLGLLAALLSATAIAQDSATRHDALAPPPAAPIRPALPGYRPFDADGPLRDWRAVNDEAGRLGGHAGQLAPATSDAASQHHHGHGGRR